MAKTAQSPTTSVADQISNLAIATDLAELTARRYRATGNMAAAAQCLRDADDCLKRMHAPGGLQAKARVGEELDGVLICNCEQAVVAYREASALMNAGTDLPPGAEFDSIALLAQRRSGREKPPREAHCQDAGPNARRRASPCVSRAAAMPVDHVITATALRSTGTKACWTLCCAICRGGRRNGHSETSPEQGHHGTGGGSNSAATDGKGTGQRQGISRRYRGSCCSAQGAQAARSRYGRSSGPTGSSRPWSAGRPLCRARPALQAVAAG